MGSAHKRRPKKKILYSLCTHGSRLREEDSTLTIPRMFSWLEHGVTVGGQHEAGVQPLIDAELNMYCYHQRKKKELELTAWTKDYFFINFFSFEIINRMHPM